MGEFVREEVNGDRSHDGDSVAVIEGRGAGMLDAAERVLVQHGPELDPEPETECESGIPCYHCVGA